jgi:hypothetical protein
MLEPQFEKLSWRKAVYDHSNTIFARRSHWTLLLLCSATGQRNTTPFVSVAVSSSTLVEAFFKWCFGERARLLYWLHYFVLSSSQQPGSWCHRKVLGGIGNIILQTSLHLKHILILLSHYRGDRHFKLS